MADHTQTARVFLRIAADRSNESPHAQTYFIRAARTHGLAWEDIAEETGLPTVRCRELAGDITAGRSAAP